MKNLLLTLLLFAAALASPAQQTAPVTTLATLNDLLARVPRANETIAVRLGYNGQNWGGERLFTHFPTNIAAESTNVAHVFTVVTNVYNVGGQWRSADRTNSVQDSRWWRMGSATADNYGPLSNAVYWMTTNFVASTLTIPAESGTNSFTTATTLTIPGNVSLKSNDAWLDFSPNGRTNATADIQYVGSISTGIPLQSAVLAGTNVITLTSSPSWNAFDIIALQNTNNYSFGGRPTYKAGEYAVVASVTASNVTLLQPLVRGYPATYTHAYKITHTTASVTGLRMKFAPGSGGLRFDYPGPLVKVTDLYLTNSYYKHLTINNGYMPTVRRVVAQDNHPSVGANYGIVVGSSYGVTIDNCYVATTRHGITFGDSETALDIPSERSRVTDTFAQAVGGVEPALDFHGIAFNNVVTDSVLYGVNAAGGNVLVNNDLFNGQNYRAVTGTEAVQFNTQLLDNRFWLTTANPDAKEWAAYLVFGPVNPGAAADVNTNIWAGTFGNTTNQYLRLQRNTLNFLTPVSRSGDYGFYVSDSTLLAANPNAVKATFGGVIATDNIAYYPDTQGFSNLNTSSLVINLITNITLRETIIKDNHLTYGGIYVLTTGGDIDIADNTIHRALDGVAAIKVIRANGAANATQHAPAYTRIWRNLITDARTGGILAYNLYGTVDARNNIIREFGLSGSTAYGMFIGGAGADLTNTFYVTHKDNSYSAASGTTAALYIETPSAPFIDVDTQLGGTTTYGTLPSVLSTKIQPYSLVGNGFTNAVAYIGRYTTANLPTTALPGAFAHDVTVDQPAFWNGTSWRYWNSIIGTNFPNIYVTNTATIGDIVARTISLPAEFPQAPFATRANPVALFLSTNTALSISVQNNNTNSSAQAQLSLSAGGNSAQVTQRSPNDSTSTFAGRLLVDGGGTGITFDIDSGDSILFTHSNGTQFGSLSQTLLTVPSLSVGASTNIPLYVAMWAGNPTLGSPSAMGSVTLANLKNSLAITAADITDSTSAGRALLTATNAAAQRTSLGLGTLAVLNDAPSDGFGYVRSNAAWARQSGGGSGGVTTNLDNLTVTNTVRFGGNFYVTDAVGGTNRFAIISDSVNSYVQFTSFGDLAVSGGAGLYASSTNNWFYNGLKQYWSGTSDLVWLTSLGFKNATPLRAATILDSTTIDWTTSGTNVTPSIKSQSLSTNLIDSTFYSLLMMTNTGGSGSTSTNYLVKALVQNAVALTVADTTLSETNMITTQPSWGVTNFAAGYWTTNNALHVEASGTFTAPGNWSGGTFKVKLGSYVLSATFEETDSLLPTDQAWRLVADIKVQTPGTNATVMGAGSLAYYYGSPGGSVSSGLAVAAASGTLDTTAQNTLSVTFDNDDSQPMTLKMASLFAHELGAEILTSGGSGSSSPASYVAVNGTTNNWNFNSTTPAASTGYQNLTLATSGSNAVVRERASYFLSSSLVGTNNSAAEFVLWTNSIPAGYIRDGGRIQLSGLLRSMNFTGSNRTLSFKLYVGPGVYTFTDNNPGSASSFRGNYYTADIFRNGSTNIFVQAFNRVDSAPGTPSSGSTLSVTAVSGPNHPTWSASVSDLDANVLPISLTVAMSVASTNYWATNVFAHITPQ